MLADRQAFDVLENKVRGLQLGHNSGKFADEAIPRIVKCPVADQRESLARSATKNYVNAAAANSCPPPDLISGEANNRLGKNRAAREIVFVDCAMDGIDFNGGDNVEAGLFEAQAKASGAGE